MIYCVWYPSGGFGHFVNAILSLYGDNFIRPTNHLNFSDNGDAHSLKLTVPKYFHDQPYPEVIFDSSKNYSVLIDNGINNQSKNFLNVFKDCNVIKLNYDDVSWPVVAKTSIVKASKSSLDQELLLDTGWNTNEDWAVREKYTLYLRNNLLRSKWTVDYDCYNLDVFELLSYSKLSNFFNAITTVSDFSELHSQWLNANSQYFYPVQQALKIIDAINQHKHMDISYVKNIWDQAVINYLLEIKFNMFIPINDYPNWFQNTNELLSIL